jgi:hypothetical protein
VSRNADGLRTAAAVASGFLLAAVLLPAFADMAWARTRQGKTAGELSQTQTWGEAPEDAAPTPVGGLSPAVPTPAKGAKPARRLGESETLNKLFPVGSPTAAQDSLADEIKEKIHQLGGERHESQEAVERLAVIGKPVVPALVRALAGDYKFTRAGALSALGYIRDPAALPGIQAALDDPAYEVRMEAIKTLGLMQHRDSVPRLAAKLSDPEPRVRRELSAALGRIRGDEARDLLLRGLHDKSPEVRRQVAQDLSAFPDPATVSALLAATRDADLKTCGFAIRALGEIGDAAARPRLEELTRSHDRFIQAEARTALQSLPTAP